MKKMIKLSLVAAVAVAGLTTSATAGSLADAIKDTTISGKALIGYNYKEVSTAGVKTSTNQTEYDLDITMTTKVNDTISFTSGVEADHDLNNRDDSTDSSSVGNGEVKGEYIGLTKAYFTAKTDVATVMIGKQKQPTPFLDDNRGDGIVAVVPAGPVTIAAGHFTGMNGGQSTAKSDPINLNLSQRDITALAVIGTVGPVNASAWYVTASDAGEANVGTGDNTNLAEHGLDAYSVNLSGKFGPVNVELNHASAELDSAASQNFDNETLTKLIVSGTVADVNLVAGYGMTNDANHAHTALTGVAANGLANTRLHGVDLTNDDDAKTNFRLDQIVLDNYNDADALLLGASMTFGATTVGANYLMATVNAPTVGTVDTDATELDLTVKYAMSKNFSITGLYSTSTIDYNTAGTQDKEDDRMELSLNYKF